MTREQAPKKRKPTEAVVIADEKKVVTNVKSKWPPEKVMRIPAAAAEVNFPRSDASTLTALERREVTEAARREVEEEFAGAKLPRNKKARIAKNDDAEDAFFGKEAAALAGKISKNVDFLHPKNLQPGTRVWGMVLELTARGLVISLPYGLRGYVSRNRASDVLSLMLKAQAAATNGGAARKKGAALLEAAKGYIPPLTDLFVVGQFVRCVVVEASSDAQNIPAAAYKEEGGSGRVRIYLSLLLKEVQSGLGAEALVEGTSLGAVVRSVEDHGYTLSFGIKGTSGFLRKKDHEAQFGEGVVLQAGGLIDVVVRNSNDKRNVIVSCAPRDVVEAVTCEGEGIFSLDSLLPGALLNVKVRKVLSDGLLVSFLTFFHGTIHVYHLPAGDWRKRYSEGTKLRARLLYVDLTSKRASLSLLPHLISLSLPSPVPVLGSVFQEAEVLRLEEGGGPGLLLRLDGLAEGPVAAYCHVSNALEKKIEREPALALMAKKFKPGTKLPARVIGYRLLDGMASVAVEPSKVNAVVQSYGHLEPGLLVTGTVCAVPDRDGDGPLLIKLSDSVKGMVPQLHGCEFHGPGTAAAKKGRIKVKVGERVEARVLDVNPEERKLTLTLRKTLVKAKAAPLVSLAQAVPGSRFQGVVSGFHDRLGVFVTFFGGLSGLAAYGALGLEAGQSAKESFAVGQIVKATVLSAAAGRIKLSLAGKSAAAAAITATPAAAAVAATATPAAAVSKPNGAATADVFGGLQPGDFAEAVVLEVHGGNDVTTGASVVLYYICRLQFPADGGNDDGGGSKHVRARLEVSHLSDHPVVVEAFQAVIRPGTKLGRVLVLEQMLQKRMVRVSRKPCLMAAAAAGKGALPKSFDDVREGAVLTGYVGSVTSDAVYVRFLAGLTGRAGLPQLSDVFVSDPHQLFTEGQSVRTQVATCDSAQQRFTLLLRPSATASTDGAYLMDYFREMQAVQALRLEMEAASSANVGNGASADAGGGDAADTDPTIVFTPGSLASATVHEVKEYGIVCDMDEHPDVVGLIPSSHVGAAGSAPPVGSLVRGRVLDVVPQEGLVELSLKQELVAGSKERGTRNTVKELKPGSPVEAVVEGIRAGEYLILSLPLHSHLLAYAAVTDYNIARTELVPRSFTLGQRLSATVAASPQEAPHGRVVCHVPLTRKAATDSPAIASGGSTAAVSSGGDDAAAGTGSKPAGRRKLLLPPGTVLEAVVTGVQPHQLDVSIAGGKATGRIHVTEIMDIDLEVLTAAAAADDTRVKPGAAKKSRKAKQAVTTAAVTSSATGATASGAAAANPLDRFRVEEVVKAVVLGRAEGKEGHVDGVMELSMRPSRLEAVAKGESVDAPLALTNVSPGQQLLCFVLEVSEDFLWLGAGPALRGRVPALDASTDPNVVANLADHFRVGSPVMARVQCVNHKKRTLDLSLVDPASGTTHGSVAEELAPDGALVMGRIFSVNGSGVRVCLGHKKAGKVALTDIHDEWVPDALEGLREGMFVRVRILGRDGNFLVLSLRPSDGGVVAGAAKRQVAVVASGAKAAAGRADDEVVADPIPSAGKVPGVLNADLIKQGATLSGYVKSCNEKGLFLTLDRERDGFIRVHNLSDGFIEDAAAAFPVGMRLEARVIKVDKANRVELTLRSSKKSARSLSRTIKSLSNLKPGQLVTATVQGVERFGVFLVVGDNKSLVGMAHVSELAEKPLKDINAVFKPGQLVRAVVLKVDLEARRFTLSLKPSKVEEAELKEGGSKGSKRRRVGDIDDEIAVAVADEAEEAVNGGEGGSEAEDEGDDVSDSASEDDVDDVEEAAGEVSSAEEEEMEEQSASDDDDKGEEEGRGGSLTRGRLGYARAGNLDLTAPWGELLLADDPRVGASVDAGGAVDVDGGAEEDQKLSKGQKKRLKEQREKDIRAAELARLSGSAAPSAAADFERLILASPNSSFMWIKYMALHLGHGDMDSARKVAQRALDTIHYKEEGEKFNVWVAWLNLENAYGSQPTPEKAAIELLKRALQYTDPKKMYLAALGIFERSGRDELASQVELTLTKKFGGSAKVWVRALERTLPKGDGESARKLLERALQSLPARKHIKLLLRAALTEFRLGSAERGRGILEGVLRNYPKRLDLWNVYIDQELKTGEQQRIRTLFERATHLPLPPKKMKFLFRRYLEYEKSEGDAEAVEHVKRRAMEFVENSLKA